MDTSIASSTSDDSEEPPPKKIIDGTKGKSLRFLCDIVIYSLYLGTIKFTNSTERKKQRKHRKRKSQNKSKESTKNDPTNGKAFTIFNTVEAGRLL